MRMRSAVGRGGFVSCTQRGRRGGLGEKNAWNEKMERGWSQRSELQEQIEYT